MKNNVLRTIILIWTILSFIVDLYFIAVTPGKIILRYLIILVVIEGSSCWIAYEMFIKKRWALILLTVYYGVHIITYFSNNFALNMQSGFKLRIDLGNSFGMNLFPLIIFILLLALLFNKTKTLSDNRL